MSIRYLREILTGSRNIVCLQGRASWSKQGNDFYRKDFIYDIEMKYGLSPDEIFSTTFYHNRPAKFFEFYREEMLKKRGEPGPVNYILKEMEDDGRLSAIVTRGYFNASKRAGCKNVIQLHGDIDRNTCPRCGKVFSAEYILEHTPIPKCDVCETMIHPGVVLSGEMLDSAVMTRAAEAISCADVLLVIGCNLSSRLGSMARYFNGDKIALVNVEEHYTDRKADCVCIGDSIENILREAYPAKKEQNR